MRASFPLLQSCVMVLFASAMLPLQAHASKASKQGLEEHLREERRTAEIVVIGRWQAAHAQQGCGPQNICQGVIEVHKTKRGSNQQRFEIMYEPYLDFVRGTNAPPRSGVCGKFYLNRASGTSVNGYAIVQYRVLRKQSSCSKKYS